MSKILNIKGATKISKAAQSKINGGIGAGADLSKCGCDCAGRVTGPLYCHWQIACLQVYTCNETH